jgi:hypothetical protein
MEKSRRLYLLALAPLLVLAHIAEEAPGLVAWLNRRVEPDLTMSGFFAINAIGLAVTVLLAVPSVRSRSHALGLALIAWLSFVMLTNGLLHLTASLAFREYVPGTVTAGVLYLPFFAAAIVTIIRNFEIRPRAAILAAAIGAVPMVVQGIGMLAVGRRMLW